MVDIPLPKGSKKEDNNSNPDANCPKYEAVHGGFCKYYQTRDGSCVIKYSRCDGYGVLKE